MLKEHHIYYFARQFALRHDRRSWWMQLGVAWLSLLCLVSLLAYIPVGRAGVPFLADSHVGTLFVLVLAAYHLPFDAGATLGVILFMLLSRLLLGPTYGHAYLSPSLGIGIPLLLFVILNYPMLVKAIRVPFRAGERAHWRIGGDREPWFRLGDAHSF